MVAKIIIGKKLRGAMHYNEHKVAEGQAELLLASGFAGDIEKMNFQQKLQRFEYLLQLKPSVKTNTLHISLNFDTAEKLEDETLQKIAIAYMEKIGFGDQPYLAYRHTDAAHDHIHLVTTNIQSNAEAINLHGIGWQRSTKAREEIEAEFNLVKAKGKLYKPEPGIKPINMEKALYGQIPTKRAISNTINAVIGQYTFTSIAELNAILKQFNVVADRGAADTVMFQKKGLVYRLLDEKGNKVGVPIKASSLYTKPTLASLEKAFIKNELKKAEGKPTLKARIDKVLNFKNHDQKSFIAALGKHGVAAVFRRSDGGQVYGITYVDHWQKTVFNGSDLGKAYAAKAIVDQLRETSSLHRENRLPLAEWQPEQPTRTSVLTNLLKTAQDGPALLPKKVRRKKKKIKI